MAAYLMVCIFISVSLAYEFTQFTMALGAREWADSFLRTQGYIWYTQ